MNSSPDQILPNIQGRTASVDDTGSPRPKEKSQPPPSPNQSVSNSLYKDLKGIEAEGDVRPKHPLPVLRQLILSGMRSTTSHSAEDDSGGSLLFRNFFGAPLEYNGINFARNEAYTRPVDAEFDVADEEKYILAELPVILPLATMRSYSAGPSQRSLSYPLISLPSSRTSSIKPIKKVQFGEGEESEWIEESDWTEFDGEKESDGDAPVSFVPSPGGRLLLLGDHDTSIARKGRAGGFSVLPFPKDRNVLLQYLRNGLSLCSLFPSTSFNGRVTCMGRHRLQQNGRWSIGGICGDTTNGDENYLRHIRERHICMTRGIATVRWFNSHLPGVSMGRLDKSLMVEGARPKDKYVRIRKKDKDAYNGIGLKRKRKNFS